MPNWTRIGNSYQVFTVSKHFGHLKLIMYLFSIKYLYTPKMSEKEVKYLYIPKMSDKEITMKNVS